VPWTLDSVLYVQRMGRSGRRGRVYEARAYVNRGGGVMFPREAEGSNGSPRRGGQICPLQIALPLPTPGVRHGRCRESQQARHEPAIIHIW
jgi:hypothetical protein